MVRRDVIGAVGAYLSELSASVQGQRTAVEGLPCKAQCALIAKLSALLDKTYEKVEALDAFLANAKGGGDILAEARYYREQVIPAMDSLRAAVDAMELNVPSKVWPYPSYGDLMFRV